MMNDLTLTATIMMQLSRNPNPTKGIALCSRTVKSAQTNKNYSQTCTPATRQKVRLEEWNLGVMLHKTQQLTKNTPIVVKLL